MTNEEYFRELDIKIEALTTLRRQGVKLARGIMGENLTNIDLFFCASLDRCLRLMDGFVVMLRERNLTCAGALLRLQMDNCMRTYAAFIAKDRNAVADCLVDGTPIKHLEDKNGKKMADWYLKEELAKIDPQFSRVYEQASGYIHLSSKAFYQTVKDIGERSIGIQVGHPLPEKRNEPLMEGASAFIHYVILHYKMLNAVCESKARFDAEQMEETRNFEDG